MKTIVVNEKTIQRQWYVVDASSQPIGRLASKIATILIGKNKVAYSPNQDHGDNVIVINAEKAFFTGKKPEIKTYFRHSMFPGGEKIRSFKEQLELDPTKIIIHAVKGMIPKNARGRAILRKLFVYCGENHPHLAQKPELIKI